MSRYIDAEKLIAEIEKRLKNVRDYMNGAGMKYKGPKYYKAQGKESAYDALRNIIISLQQEQPQVADASKTELPESGCSEKPNDLLSEWTEEDERTRWNLCSLLTNLRVGKKIEESTFKKYYSWLKIIHIKPRKTRKQEQPEQIEEYGPYARQYPKSQVSYEQPEVDLEKEAVSFCFDNGINISPRQAKNIACHFFELGKKSK